MQKIIVTGGTGFIGRALVKRLAQDPGNLITIATRQTNLPQDQRSGPDAQGYRGDQSSPDRSIKSVQIAGLKPDTNWAPALEHADIIIHCAGQTPGPAMAKGTAGSNGNGADGSGSGGNDADSSNGNGSNSTTDLHDLVNHHGTLNLARQAADANVKRFVFLSTSHVHAALNPDTSRNQGTPLREDECEDDDLPQPNSAYARSKLAAEQGLRALSRETAMQICIIRPPLVYGPGVKGNLRLLAKLIARGVPLPFGSVNNQRSLISANNLSDVLALCAVHPKAAGETFLVSDGADVSTADIIRHLARCQNRGPRLVPFPPKLQGAMLRMLGRRNMADQLFGSMQIDASKVRNMLDWTPPETPQNAQWC